MSDIFRAAGVVGPVHRLGDWTLQAADGRAGVVAHLVTEGRQMRCDVAGVRLRPRRHGPGFTVRVVGRMAMRTTACGVADADAAMDAADELFEALLALACPPATTRLRGPRRPARCG